MFTTSKSFAKSELHLHRRHSTVIHELSSSMMLLTTYHDFAAEKPSAFVSPAKRLVLVCLLDMQLWAIAPMVAVGQKLAVENRRLPGRTKQSIR